MATPKKSTKRTARKSPSARAPKRAQSSTGGGAAGASSNGGAGRGSSSARGRSAAASRTAVRWTEDQVKVLLDAVKAAPTAKAGFETASRELGKTVGTVQQKYYSLQRKAGNARPRRTTRATSAAASQRQSGAGGRGAGPVTPQFLSGLTADQLLSVADLVRGEVHRRQEQLRRAADMFK